MKIDLLIMFSWKRKDEQVYFIVYIEILKVDRDGERFKLYGYSGLLRWIK